MAEIECVVATRDQFGESPLWSPSDQSLYWVDVTAPAVRRYHPATCELRSWPMAEDIGSIGLRRAGGLVAGMRSGFYILDLDANLRKQLATPAGHDPRLRFNDGKCDRAGRFWSGTLDDVGFGPVGTLYRLGPDHRCAAMDSGFVLVNGLAWSPDDRFMYLADSRREVVYRYDFDLARGSIANRRPFISTEGIPGRVDGATVASDGTYWCAHVRGGQVAQYDPDGNLMRAIPLPVKYPLMCTFGGPDLTTLYVTTCLALVTPDEAADQPLAGALLAIHGTGCTGLAEPSYAG
jgi:L-arabinonolactonase